jgi:hypothetical protein
MSNLDSILEMSGISSVTLVIVLVVWKIIASLNNKRCRSTCCSRSAEVSVAVNELSEEEKKSPVLTVVSSRRETPVPPLSLEEMKAEAP